MRPTVITQPGEYTINVQRDERQAVFIAQTAAQSVPTNVTVNLTGAGATATVTGAFIHRHRDHSQLNVLIHHLVPKTSATFLMKGILFDAAREAFTGLIRIDREAQQTSSFLEHRTLLLSDDAAVEPVPSLEILAHDVTASHAATISHLSDEDRFYLRSRGLDQPTADALLIRSFLDPVLANMPPTAKKQLLAQL